MTNGKKCIVIPYVGKMTVRYSSKSKGNLKVMGEMRLANMTNAKRRLKMISPYFGMNFRDKK